MRGAAIEFADRAGGLDGAFDLVFANDMMSVADWRALAPRELADLPVITYFHENQLTYPVPDESERDYQYGFTNVTTCLASDEVWFNSAYHMEDFLGGVERLLKKMPDHVPVGVPERIRQKARVVHPGIDVPESVFGERRRPPTVLWNQRWEWDKNPEEFFDALGEVRRRGIAFRLVVAGETFRERPEVFDRARGEFADAIDAWGYVESREEYLRLLGGCDVVVSTARHEFFGLSVAEAVAAGCVPLLPARLSYPEVVVEESAFYGDGELAERLSHLLSSETFPPRAEMRGLVERFDWRRRIREWDALFHAAAG
jgi:glycosyltransferase involved in cell wall biosynthesis